MVIGKCTDMCPWSEVQLRKEQKRIHYLEKNPTTKEVDPAHCVKEYVRSAAGSEKCLPELLRTPETLLKTTQYLLGDLFTNIKDEKDYIPACNFIADRLRAVRQDLIVQQCNWEFAVPILELIVKYHIHITWQLRHFSSKDFDKTLNISIRNSYIGDLFEYYQYLLRVGNAFGLNNYPEFLAYKVLLNYRNSFIIMEAYQKLLWIRENYGNQKVKVIAGPLQFCLSYHTRNFSRMFSLLSEFNIMQKMCVLDELNKFRIEFLQILNYAYTNKLLKFSCDKLKSWLRFNTKETTEEFVKTCGIEIKDGFVLFTNKSLHINVENDKIKELVEKSSDEDDAFIGEASWEL